MNIPVRDLDLAIKLLTKTLPPIVFSISRDKQTISLVNLLHTPRKTRGSKSKIALQFYTFLFNRGDLISYIHNVFQHCDLDGSLQEHIPDMEASDYIDEAFPWRRTTQQDEYWNRCHVEWLDTLTILQREER